MPIATFHRAGMQIRSLVRDIVFSIKNLRRPSVAYCAQHSLLPGIFVRTPPAKLRELMLLPKSLHTTQLNQDIFALLANRFRAGFFIEIGANDGFTLSNTVYLEEHFEWNGLLVEANPQYLNSLKSRKAKAVIAAVVEKEGDYDFCSAGLYGGIVELLDKTHEERTQKATTINVWGTTLEQILLDNDAPKVINFISIDVEGAEVSIVEQMCRLQEFRFASGCIEYNARQADYKRINTLLQEAGYRVVWEGQTQHDLFFVDDRGLAFGG